ncbi:MAG: M48 family metallopeptidase [Sulfuricurvum sp.]
MLMLVVFIYTIYVLISVYVSVMQIGFINSAKNSTAVLLPQREFVDAAKYSIARQRLSIVQSFVDYMLFLFWLGFGLRVLESVVLIQNEAMLNIVAVLIFVLVGVVLHIPFSYYEKFVLDEQAGFNKSTKAQWVKDTIISFAMTMLIGGVIIWGVYLIISSFTLWWLWSFAFLFVVLVAVMMLFPTFRALFFDKMKPLEDAELAKSIADLMDRTGFVSSGVFVSDASKRDSRLNAYFGGLGKSKRVVLYDTLMQKLSKEEILAVLAHELGHFAHGDIYKNIAMSGAVLFGAFALFGNLPQSLYMELGISSSAWAIMILFMLFMTPLGFFMTPLMGFVSRHNEYEADKMSCKLGGVGGEVELANALIKLVKENKSFPLSHPIYIFFHYTHPPVLERLKALGVDLKNI